MEQHYSLDQPSFSTDSTIENLALLREGKLVMPTDDPLFDFQFQRMIVVDNHGNIMEKEEYLEEGSPKLNNNSLGKDTNPKTKPLPKEQYCEKCECEYLSDEKGTHTIITHQPDAAEKSYSRCTGCRRVRYCSSECQLAHWDTHRANCLIECEVIFTFWYKKLTGQGIYNVFIKKTSTEEEFITAILNTLPVHAPNYHDLHHLVKISTCPGHIMRNEKGKRITEDDGWSFLDKNKGKYYFHGKYENSVASRLWAKFLGKYILTR